MNYKCQMCEKKPVANIVLIVEPMKLRARAMCKDCSAYTKPWGEAKAMKDVATLAVELPKEMAAILHSDPSNDPGLATAPQRPEKHE